MRICFLAPGNSVHSYRWIKYFAEQGHDVHWISHYSFTTDSIQGVVVHDLSKMNSGVLRIARCAWSVRRLVQQIAPDVLHVHSAGIYGLLGVAANFHPLVLTAWGSDILLNGKSLLKRPIVKHILRNADVVTTDAEHMITAMERLGKERSRMTLIRFGVDTERFKPATPDAGLRERLGIVDLPTIISLRNFYPLYDIETLINAMPHVLARVPSAKVILVGTGPQEEELKLLAQSLGLDTSVKFLGKLPNEDLPRYLSSMDVYVSTSLSDAGIAASTAEAMACGLASIVTDSGENRLWITDGLDGYVVAVSDPKKLADRIVSLLVDEGLRKKFRERGRQVIVERNDYRKEMAAMIPIYTRLTAGQQPVLNR